MNNLNLKNFDQPWNQFYDNEDLSLDYPDETLYESIERISNLYPDYNATIFMDKKTKYKDFFLNINNCAKALKSFGVEQGDVVSIIMPNCPQALVMLYALNCVGAIACMIHPLSSEKEIEFDLKVTKSKIALTCDLFSSKCEQVLPNTTVRFLVIASLSDELPFFKKLASRFFSDNKKVVSPNNERCMSWKNFISHGETFHGRYKVSTNAESDAIILFSGGTTGSAKGIRIKNRAFKCLSMQINTINKNIISGKNIYSGMPIFHGLGLATICHGTLSNGGCCLLVAKINVKNMIDDISKYECSIVAGVPTLFKGMLKSSSTRKYNLSFLGAVYCGGDSLSPSLEQQFNDFLHNNNCKLNIRVGYGLTECLTAVTISPEKIKTGSVGIPLPDTLVQICIPGTHSQVPYGQTGEICIYGATLMSGYLNNDEETDLVLQRHNDGRIWLHTGDLGYMDSDGYLFFVQRLKRIIVSSGYNVYPMQVEKIINEHNYVDSSCVIGIPDSYKGQKVKAFVKLKDGISQSDEIKTQIMDYTRKHIAKYALPSEIEFRDSLPTTIVGKVDYRFLENEELSKS